jgi:hypothetical protein
MKHLLLSATGIALVYVLLPDVSRLQALANKDRAQLKAGMEIPVTQEISSK